VRLDYPTNPEQYETSLADVFELVGLRKAGDKLMIRVDAQDSGGSCGADVLGLVRPYCDEGGWRGHLFYLSSQVCIDLRAELLNALFYNTWGHYA
jgi:hypothetical protein